MENSLAMKKIIKRILAILPAIIIQLLWYMALFKWLSRWANLISGILSLFAFLYILYIITKEDDGTYKMLWLLTILVLPIFGTILYFMFGNKRTTKSLHQKLVKAKTTWTKISAESASEEIKDERIKDTFQYIESLTSLPTKRNNETNYYPLGEDAFPAMLQAMEQAKKYIFMEYFIIERGKMLDSIVEVLIKKAKEGVDVRLMYDDLGSIGTFEEKEAKYLRDNGIQCVAFNPVKFITGTLNYRDHRKMTIVDGSIVFSGGINIADEYINEIEKYGHWKDISFSLVGEPVNNYVRMFIEFWNAFSKDIIPLERYIDYTTHDDGIDNGYALSYYDSPIKNMNISNELYIELLSQAKETAYFYTPYLMLGDALLDAFKRAARRGVDVRIMMPGVPDKKLIFRMSRSFYEPLLQSGVKIYEYTPGFVHAKACVIDHKVGSMGTVNLDYRSLFLHFENNSIFYDCPVLQDLEKDFLLTQTKCQEIVLGKNYKVNFVNWLLNGILRIYSPLC